MSIHGSASSVLNVRARTEILNLKRKSRKSAETQRLSRMRRMLVHYLEAA
jgi:hypothetical protein